MIAGVDLSLIPVSASSPGNQSMRWALRYAIFCGIQAPDSDSSNFDQTIKKMFTPAAWRLLCRSSRENFNPILRHRGLKFDALVLYAERLIEHGWQEALPGHLLAYLIDQSYLFLINKRVCQDTIQISCSCGLPAVKQRSHATTMQWSQTGRTRAPTQSRFACVGEASCVEPSCGGDKRSSHCARCRESVGIFIATRLLGKAM